MPSQNMLPKGDRRRSVKKEYREQRTLIQEREAALRAAGEDVAAATVEMIDTAEMQASPSPFAHMPGLVTTGPSGGKHPQEEQSARRYPAPRAYVEAPPEIQIHEDLEPEDGIRSITAESAAKDMRLDTYLAKALPDISRARVTLLIENGQVTVNGEPAKGKQKLKGGELIEIEGDPRPEPLHATPEDIALEIVYEDEDLAVVNKAAGMMVHAGAGDEERNRGTLVNALLFHLGKDLSQVSGELRPGIVHRLDKQTSGLIVVAKNDSAHRKLGEMFAERRLRKIYLALVHGAMEKDEGTVSLPISRDVVRRTRMTTRRMGGRSAVSHWRVLERIDGPFGKFTLVEVRIETGRTHQIRVHMQALGHAVVGDTLYGAPHRIVSVDKTYDSEAVELERNFLHAAELEFLHPRTKVRLELRSELPEELTATLERLRH
ncbi:MAG: RluA family pseudouridine synthase [Acidobacteriaceae bacterium]